MSASESQKLLTERVEKALAGVGLPSKHTSLISSGAYLLRMGEGRTVDVYPSGNLVLAYSRGEMHFVSGYRSTDLPLLLDELKNGAPLDRTAPAPQSRKP